MVQILDSNPSFSQQLGAQLGKAGGTIAQQLAEDSILRKHGVDVAGLTGYARDVKIKEGIKRAALIGEGRRGLDPLGATPGNTQTPGIQSVQGQQAQPGTQPTSRQQMNQPIQQAQGQESKYVPPEQIKSLANRNAHEKLNRGIPTTIDAEVGLIEQDNARLAQHQARQEVAGAKARDALSKVYPDATDEQQAILARKAEQYITQGLSVGEQDRRMAVDAKNMKNQVSSIEKALPPKRFYTVAKEKLLGTGRSAEKTRESIRLKLKPLLDDAQFDTARTLLKNRGYGPEEAEAIVSNLSNETKKNLQGFEPIKKGAFHDDPSYRAFKEGSPEAQKFGQNLQQTMQADPATNLILLRKEYEDRGVDWRSFKDQLDNLQSQDVFKPNDDQMKQIDLLDQPPLDRLDVLLHNFGFKGR